jgi:Kef-type K+ transport system membrane component KefB
MRSNFRALSGAFLAGLAVDASAREAPASLKLQFLGKSLFIPIFFVVTGFLIDPVEFVYGIFDNFLLVSSIIGCPARRQMDRRVARGPGKRGTI